MMYSNKNLEKRIKGLEASSIEHKKTEKILKEKEHHKNTEFLYEKVIDFFEFGVPIVTEQETTIL